MTSLTEAQNIILGNISRLPSETVPLMESPGRILAGPVHAPWDLPLVDNSAMDGYAVRSAECASGALLCVAGYSPAGTTDSATLAAGEAFRIMTGAPIPFGANAVVPIEECLENGEQVSFAEEVKKGQHIRFKGEDFSSREIVLSEGSIVRPAEINMLASLGRALVPVYRAPRVAIVATGDELVELGMRPEPGQVVNSNSLAVAAAVKELGAIPILAGIARDTRESHRTILAAALDSDIVITSAGVSAGDRDLVREILAELGVVQHFWKIAIKPGGPTAFGMFGKIPVFSLPGNPVSTLLTFELLVRPAILKMMGHVSLFKAPVKAVLMEEAKPKSDKLSIVRVKLTQRDGRLFASSAGDQKTGFLKTLVSADGYILLQQGDEPLPSGTEMDAYLLGERQLMKEAL
jgi:molybdopterin molybdotransferase